jgi:hypothetical protein
LALDDAFAAVLGQRAIGVDKNEVLFAFPILHVGDAQDEFRFSAEGQRSRNCIEAAANIAEVSMRLRVP